jgi:BolA family transcriptional regulator, general stress-responsive regulator
VNNQNMEIMNRIEVLLREKLAIEHLQIIDESYQHAGHMEAGAAQHTHFRLKIASSDLGGISRVAQHRAIYSALAPLINNPIHALAIEIA